MHQTLNAREGDYAPDAQSPGWAECSDASYGTKLSKLAIFILLRKSSQLSQLSLINVQAL